MKIPRQEIFSHFNIMYHVDIEKADDVAVCYDSDDSHYDEEELHDHIYNGIWDVN